MQDDFNFTGGGGNVIRKKGMSLKAAYTSAAVCPECGEISLYVDKEKLEKLCK